MSWGIRDHGAFQRAALVQLGLGGALGALAGLVPVGDAQLLLAAVIGTAALTSVLAEARARGGRVGPRLALPVLGVLLGVGLAWRTWEALAVAPAGLAWSLAESATAGALFGLVAAVGLVPGHLARTRRDPVAEGLAAARAGFRADGGNGEEWALVQRAAAAHERTRAGLAAERSDAAAELRAGASNLTLQVIELAGRCRELRLELGTVDLGELDGRGAALAAAAGATADQAAREDFNRAARTTTELRERLAALRAAHDRLRARLSLQVTILESTALAVSTRRASDIAQAAASLAPLSEKVREAGQDLEAQSLALAEP
jgi:hypothetical protein